jgi:RNA polymerase sigma factor (sigma-70 family)
MTPPSGRNSRLAPEDRHVLAAVFERLRPVVKDYCRRNLPCTSDAEDATQQVLLTLFTRRDELDSTKNARSWALTLARFEVLTARKARARRRELSVEDVSWFGSDQSNVEHQIIAHESQLLLTLAVSTLRPSDQAIVRGILDGSAAGSSRTDPRSRKRKQRALARLRLRCREVCNYPSGPSPTTRDHEPILEHQRLTLRRFPTGVGPDELPDLRLHHAARERQRRGAADAY